MALVKVSPTKICQQERSAMIGSWAPKKIALVHGRRMVPYDGQEGGQGSTPVWKFHCDNVSHQQNVGCIGLKITEDISKIFVIGWDHASLLHDLRIVSAIYE